VKSNLGKIFKGLSQISHDVTQFLSSFYKVGIAIAADFEDISNHPKNLMLDFESAIVYVSSNSSGQMGVFDNYFEVIASQNDVVDYLTKLGYKAEVIDGSSDEISLVTAGVKTGIGDISPVNSLVVKGIGLTGAIGVILTNAPLEKMELDGKTCTNCMKCLKVCPIREEANAKGNLDNCACGKCVNICPV